MLEKLIQLCLIVTRKIHNYIIPNIKEPEEHYEETLNSHITANISWLDYGCGKKILVPWRPEKEKELVNRCSRVAGVDPAFEKGFEHRTIKELYKVENDILPFPDCSFDLVTANMVMEHLEDPIKNLNEIKRVLKTDGIFIFHTPNTYGHIALISSLIPESLNKILAYLLTGRKADDVFKTYYKSNTKDQITKLSKQSGFKVEQLNSVQGFPLAMGILIPPIYLLELIWVKVTTLDIFSNFRGNIIAVLRKET